jgi:hypothetical protein
MGQYFSANHKPLIDLLRLLLTITLTNLTVEQTIKNFMATLAARFGARSAAPLAFLLVKTICVCPKKSPL